MEGARLRPVLPGIIGLLVFLLAAMHGYRLLVQVVESTDARKDARQTLVQTVEVLSLLKDVETGQRGYIITGDPAYLKPYEDALGLLHSRHDAMVPGLLRMGVSAEDVRILGAHMDAKLDIAAAQLALRREQGLEAARQAIMTGRGKAAMDTLRDDFTRLEGHLYERIGALNRQVEALQADARRAGILLAILATLLLGASYLMLVREHVGRMRAEQALTARSDELARLRGAELESVFDALPDLFFRLAPDGTILDYRARRDDLYVAPEHFLGKPMQSVLPPEVGALFESHLNRLKAGGGMVAFEYPLAVAGRERHFEARMSSLAGMQEVVLVVRDVTEQVEGKLALIQAQDHLRAFARKLDRDIESERKRLGREVHDQIGQIFTALKMKLLGWQPGKPVDGDMVADFNHLLDEGIGVARRISADLRPAMLDDLGLGPALEQYGRLFGERSGLAVEVAVAPDRRLAQEQTNQLYRIAQEALTNVVHHAGARRARIQGGAQDGHYVLAVEDDGRGLAETGREGLGMLGMRERAELMGARLEVDASPLGGLGLSIILPLIEEES